MAQVQEKNDSKKGAKRSVNRNTMQLDMTPMVDLAFLLLTFFMLTTTFTKLQVMDLRMPVEPKDPTQLTPIKGENALTVIMGEDDKIYYYFGFAGDEPKVEKTDYSASGIRKVLLSEKVKSNKKMVVLIKAMETSNYGNLVDMLDEIKIAETSKYALVDINPEDKELIEELR